MKLLKIEEKGLSKSEQKAIKASRKRGNLFFHSLAQIEDYHPDKDAKIRQLLVAVRRIVPDGVQSQGFIERLAFYWKMKITFHLDEIWHAIRMRELTGVERESYLDAAKRVGDLIEFARNELRSQTYFPRAETWLDSGLELYLASLFSYLEDPIELNEARVIDFESYDNRKPVISKIPEAEQAEPSTLIIKPLPELDEDDLMGQQLRDMDLISGWPIGRMMVAGWNLDLVELENGELLTPIESMLIEFGGCPRGWVYDSRERYHPAGYNATEKSCKHCWKKEFCPGTGELRMRSLGGLAAKLRYAWLHRHDIESVFPKFAPLKLTHQQMGK